MRIRGSLLAYHSLGVALVLLIRSPQCDSFTSTSMHTRYNSKKSRHRYGHERPATMLMKQAAATSSLPNFLQKDKESSEESLGENESNSKSPNDAMHKNITDSQLSDPTLVSDTIDTTDPGTSEDSAAITSPDSSAMITASKKSKPKTLYQVLGVSQTASKSEIKRSYIQLAKQSHPDALQGKIQDQNLDFSEINAAYRVLSDKKQRKRYDRKLNAEAFSQELQKFASDVTDTAAPHMKDLFDSAMPFLRRTTATTLASIQAAAKDISRSSSKSGGDGVPSASSSSPDQEPIDLGDVFVSAMKAAQRAGRIVDNLELLEKSEVVEEKVLQQMQQANQLKQQLEDISVKRLSAVLRTPNVTITSQDAFALLQAWNVSKPTRRSLLERVRLKNRVNVKIDLLEEIEMARDEKEIELKAALADYHRKESALQQARAEKVLAIQAEAKAREALARAQRKVVESRERVENETKVLDASQAIMEKIVLEKNRLVHGLTRQQEAVKAAMLKKEAKVGLQGSIVEDNVTLAELKSQEAALLDEYEKLEASAQKLQEQANKLKARAERIKQKD